MIELFRTHIAGLKHGDIQKLAPDKYLKPGQEVKMFWERSNEYDPMAIRVEINGMKMGYIPKELTKQIHELREKKIKCHCQVSAYFPQNVSWMQLYVIVANMEKDVTEDKVEL